MRATPTAQAAIDPLSLRERVGVREPRGKQAGVNGNEWERQGYWGALTRPSATLSQRERGWIWDGSHRPSATLSQRERGWVWDESHRPSATLSQRERGWVWDESHRPSATLSQRERGWVWDGSHRPSATLSQRERGFDTAWKAGVQEGRSGYRQPLSSVSGHRVHLPEQRFELLKGFGR